MSQKLIKLKNSIDKYGKKLNCSCFIIEHNCLYFHRACENKATIIDF